MVASVCGEDGYAAVDIGGDPELEARYRERLPVVAVDGEPLFTFFVQEDVLRQRLRLPA